jgi:hypothetical protein
MRAHDRTIAATVQDRLRLRRAVLRLFHFAGPLAAYVALARVADEFDAWPIILAAIEAPLPPYELIRAMGAHRFSAPLLDLVPDDFGDDDAGLAS